MSVTLSGCPAIPFVDRMLSTQEKRKAHFEQFWNSQIGKYHFVEPLKRDGIVDAKNENPFGRNSTEYVIRQHRVCKLGLEEDNETRKLVSWRYITEPEKCWEYVPSLD